MYNKDRDQELLELVYNSKTRENALFDLEENWKPAGMRIPEKDEE